MSRLQVAQLELDLFSTPAIALNTATSPPAFVSGDRIQVVAIASHSPEVLGKFGKVQRVMQGAVIVVFAVLDELPDLGAIAFEPCHLSRVDTAAAKEMIMPAPPEREMATLAAGDRVQIVDTELPDKRLSRRFAIIRQIRSDSARVVLEAPLEEGCGFRTLPCRCLVQVSDPQYQLFESPIKGGKPRVAGNFYAWRRTFWTRVVATDFKRLSAFEQRRALAEFAHKEFSTNVTSGGVV